MPVAGRAAAARPRPSRGWLRRWVGLAFVAPWLLAFVAFDAIPIFSGFYHSFTDWSITGSPTRFVGLANYREAFTRDPLFWKAVTNTLYYIGFSVPIGIVTAFSVALLLNRRIRGTTLYRTIYYLPSVVPTVAATIVWTFIFETRRGILNWVLEFLHLPIVRWLSDPAWAKPALIIMSLWGMGSSMVIYLAGLQGVPQELYEAAEIDGASGWQRLVGVTVPLMTPTIFFNLMMGLINAFQVFNSAFIMTGGGPFNATLFYMLHLYNHAFRYFRMGYAAALAVVLFVVVLTLTAIVNRTSDRWVYYS
ncbi:MAG: sugar ABC transporter permease [Anaerolineae bacterium]|nr:sugar ABC transporter permease [Anaerolineae bacterium]